MGPVTVLLALLVSACGGGAGIAPPGDPEPVGAVPPPPLVGQVPFDVPIADLLVDPGPEAGSVVLRFTAPGEAGAQADAYVVHSSVRPIWPATLGEATPVAVSKAPSAPGTREEIVLRGLTPDRTLYFGVQARKGTDLGAFGFAAAGHVTGRDVPAPPAGAIYVDGPATLSQRGATYVLTRDVAASGTAFVLAANDVTLDLSGHTVTYGTGGATAHGVHGTNISGAGRVTVRNGALRQGGTAARGHAVSIHGLDGARLSYLDIDVSGSDAQGIWLSEAGGALRIDHCTVACRTQVVSNRHYPGVSAIYVEQSTGGLEIDHNRITASPQWGIRFSGPSSSGAVLVHHNHVIGTKALVANGYMIGVHKPDAEVFENLLAGESRGIHVDEEDTAGRNAWVHDNDIRAQDQPNAEYPQHWVHGVKIESANACRLEHNRIRTTADPQHAEAYGLDVQLGDARGIVVRHNVIESLSSTPALPAYAVNWTYGASGSRSDDFLARFNVLTATDTLVNRWWSGGRGGLFRDNWWHRDLSQGAGHAFRFEYFGNGNTIESKGHRFLDPVTTLSLLDVEQWASPAPYESTREWTLWVFVRDGGDPVAGARVSALDRSGQSVFEATTNADGEVARNVLGTLVSRGPAFATASPYTITVRRDAETLWSGTQAVEAPTGLLVDAATRSAAVDRSAPPAPSALKPWPLSASRALVLWDAPEDETRVVRYLVELDGKPAGITDEAGIFLGGLEANRSYAVRVQAVDAGGNVSPRSASAAFTTRPEDRGP